MSGQTAFQLLNLLVLPWWGLWLAAPRSHAAARAAGHSGIFLALSALYTLLLAAALLGGPGGGVGYDGLRAAFGHPLVFLAGWTHYLCFDLFCGAWIVREARRLELEPRGFLLATLLAGPIGLGAFLARRAWHLRTLGQLGETDLA